MRTFSPPLVAPALVLALLLPAAASGLTACGMIRCGEVKTALENACCPKEAPETAAPCCNQLAATPTAAIQTGERPEPIAPESAATDARFAPMAVSAALLHEPLAPATLSLEPLSQSCNLRI